MTEYDTALTASIAGRAVGGGGTNAGSKISETLA